MNEKLNISVIIPVYNAEKTIIQCLESVFYQSYKAYEIIIINDGSTDNTLALINDYINTNKITNLFLITQKNSGPSIARNSGIVIAKGDWIAFIDSDDKWLPNKLEKQIDIIRINSSIMLVGTRLISDKYKKIDAVCKEIRFESMLFKNQIYTSTVLVNKKVVLQHLFNENQKFSEDYRLWLLIISQYNCVVINEGLAIYAENKKKFNRESLSSKLLQMEIGELSNYIFLYKTKRINFFLFSLVSFISIIKFIKRYLEKNINL